MGDISSEVTVEGWKYDLVNMTRFEDKNIIFFLSQCFGSVTFWVRGESIGGKGKFALYFGLRNIILEKGEGQKYNNLDNIYTPVLMRIFSG